MSWATPDPQLNERIALIYVDKWNKMNGVEDYRRIIAHVTTDGFFDDLFFNTVLFLGQEAREGNFEVGTASRDEWDWWLGLILGKNGEARLLENAAAEIDVELPLDYVGVILMIPRPRTEESLQDRIESVKTYVQKAEDMFESARFSKLKLKGFYWMSESSDGDEDLIREVSQFLHSTNHTFYWIPYFNAKGYDNWKQLGFDKVMLQPNFAFYESGMERFEEVNRRIKLYNFSVEMELPSYKRNPEVMNWTESLLLYLWASMKYDWGKLSYMSYYYGNDFASMGGNATTKKFYDLIYLHVRGKLDKSSYHTEIDQAYEQFNGRVQSEAIPTLISAGLIVASVLFVILMVFVAPKRKTGLS